MLRDIEFLPQAVVIGMAMGETGRDRHEVTSADENIRTGRDRHEVTSADENIRTRVQTARRDGACVGPSRRRCDRVRFWNAAAGRSTFREEAHAA